MNRFKKEGSRAPRFLAFTAVLLAMFAYLLSGLVELQLKSSDIYAEKAESGRTKTIVLRGKRGNITDAESVTLAEDVLIYKEGGYEDITASPKNLIII